jgi:predicted O-methyltransferase YrrM
MSWSAEFAVAAVTPAVGATLRLLATAARARAVVEIGTGLGVSGLWLLAGMRPDGVLTTIDVEPDHQAMARQAYAAAGHSTSRTRLISGSARTVLPRLADGAYDLVFVDGDMEEYPHCVSAAHRLLREDGVLVVHNALGGATSALAAQTVRELIAYLRDAPEWTPTLVPVGPALLVATRRP